MVDDDGCCSAGSDRLCLAITFIANWVIVVDDWEGSFDRSLGVLPVLVVGASRVGKHSLFFRPGPDLVSRWREVPDPLVRSAYRWC